MIDNGVDRAGLATDTGASGILNPRLRLLGEAAATSGRIWDR
jgi:hypothetical protein